MTDTQTAYSLSPKVQRVLHMERISKGEFAEMLRLSSPFRHSRGNRRYHNWVMLVQGEDVLDMVTVQPPMARGPQMRMPNPAHSPCKGLGCGGCNYWGSVSHFL